MTPATLLTDADVVDKMALLYSDGIKAFDYGMNPVQDNGICWAICRIGDVLILIFRGSVTPEDWARDFLTIMVPRSIAHPSGGLVEAGFALGMDEACRVIVPLLNLPFIVGGHSLGGAHACYFMARYDGAVPLLRGVLCGCPKPGDAAFVKTIAKYDIPSYHNGPDPVPKVPFKVKPLWPYDPPRLPPRVFVQHPTNGPGLFNSHYHKIGLYQAGVRGYPPMQKAA